MVLGLLTDISLQTVWFVSKNIASGAYWLAFGSIPSKTDILLEKMAKREQELMQKLENIEKLLAERKIENTI